MIEPADAADGDGFGGETGAAGDGEEALGVGDGGLFCRRDGGERFGGPGDVGFADGGRGRRGRRRGGMVDDGGAGALPGGGGAGGTRRKALFSARA